MVDPDRKINRHNNSKDIEYLNEIEENFADRFSYEDEKFIYHCDNALLVPPIIDDDENTKLQILAGPKRGSCSSSSDIAGGFSGRGGNGGGGGSGGSGGSGGGGWNHYSGGRARNNRYTSYEQRNRNRGYRNYNSNYDTYSQRNYRNRKNDKESAGSSNYYNQYEEQHFEQKEQNNQRDEQQSSFGKSKYSGGYGNFVPASKD